MSPRSRLLSLANLSALGVAPPELVHHAATAGFDLVGALRLIPASDGRGYDMLGDVGLRQRTAAALDATGLSVLDVEVFRLRAGTAVSTAEPMLAAGAELGARFLLCTVEDPDVDRRAAAFAELCTLASSYSLRCLVEPMVFSAVRTPAQAVALVSAGDVPGAGVLVDALHLERAGCAPADLDAVDPALLPLVQVCDAATRGPAVDLADAVAEAVGMRLAPGEGALPLVELVRRLPADAPLSVEAPNPAARDDPAAWVQRLAAAGRRLVAAASQGPHGASAPG